MLFYITFKNKITAESYCLMVSYYLTEYQHKMNKWESEQNCIGINKVIYRIVGYHGMRKEVCYA